jgi:hypothetical protein
LNLTLLAELKSLDDPPLFVRLIAVWILAGGPDIACLVKLAASTHLNNTILTFHWV